MKCKLIQFARPGANSRPASLAVQVTTQAAGRVIHTFSTSRSEYFDQRQRAAGDPEAA